MAQEKYREAIPIFRKSIEAIQEDYGSDSVRLVPSLHLLARSLWRNGDKAEAQTTLARCSRLTSLALADSNTDSENLIFKAGCHDEWLLYQGEFETAAKGFRASLAFEEKEGRKKFDPEQMPVWEILAEAEEALGNWDAAQEAYLLAIAEWDKRLSPRHPRSDWARQRLAEKASGTDPICSSYCR